LAVHGEGRGEFRTCEPLDDVENPGVVGGLTDRTAKIGSVKLAVGAWCGLDPGQQFSLSGIERLASKRRAVRSLKPARAADVR